MSANRGDVALLNDPVAQELLASKHPANLAYVAADGTPRSIPIWFHWNGEELVLGTPPDTPKMDVLDDNPSVAITIHDETFPYKVLMIRGKARTNMVNGVPSEYSMAAQRFLGEEAGKEWVAGIDAIMTEMARIVVKPEWVAVLDFVGRFPRAVERAMARAQGSSAAQ